MKIQEVASKYEKISGGNASLFPSVSGSKRKGEYETSKAIKAELDKMGSLGYHADWKQEFCKR